MKPRQLKRVAQVESVMAVLPIRTEVLQHAFDVFRESGELPEQQRLAAEVVQVALRGGHVVPPQPEPVDLLTGIRRLAELARQWEAGELPPEPPRNRVREHVFNEAVYGPGVVREAARVVLQWEVGCGADVTDPQFLADKPLPKHPGVGLHILGFPERLASPPYEAQGQRLFARYDVLRDRIDHDAPGWFDAIEDAILRFHDTGDLPEDDLMRDTVLADAELDALLQHHKGIDVTDLMAALDHAAQASEGERDDTIRVVQQRIRLGRRPLTLGRQDQE